MHTLSVLRVLLLARSHWIPGYFIREALPMYPVIILIIVTARILLSVAVTALKRWRQQLVQLPVTEKSNAVSNAVCFSAIIPISADYC